MTKPNPETLNRLRVRIAELCGWKFTPSSGPLEMPWWNSKKDAWDGNNWSGRASMPPNYPEDLNAMHEAEKLLILSNEVNYFTYERKLSRLIDTQDTGVFLHHAEA